MRYVEPSEYRKLAKDKPPRDTGVKFTSIAAPEVAAESRTFRFCFSDSGVDLQGDKLNANGWCTENFDRNPVVLFSHDATQPIGKASNLQVEDGRLLGDITFAETPLADEIYQLVNGGFVRAVSVGFMPIKYTFSDEPNRAGGIDYQSMSLLEVSVCSIPANPRALIEARAQGIPTGQLESWLIDRIADKNTTETDRAVFKALVNKSMDESDPSAGGYTVGNCGRDKDDECGMFDPQECEVHRDIDEYEDEGKALMAIVKQAHAEIRRLNEEIKALRRTKTEGDDPEDHEGEDGEVHLNKGLAHIKAAEELHDSAVDHMEEAHKCFKAFHKCFKDMDDGDDDAEDRIDEEDKSDDDGDDEIEKIKARAIARMAR